MFSMSLWLEVTIAGFVYLAAAFFTILAFAGKDDLGFLNSIREFIPYLALIVLFASYVVGMTAHILMQEVVIWFFPEYGFTAGIQLALQQNTPREILTSLGYSYGAMLLLRHLALASLFLAVSLLIWLRKKPK